MAVVAITAIPTTAQVPISNRDRVYIADQNFNPVSVINPAITPYWTGFL